MPGLRPAITNVGGGAREDWYKTERITALPRLSEDTVRLWRSEFARREVATLQSGATSQLFDHSASPQTE